MLVVAYRDGEWPAKGPRIASLFSRSLIRDCSKAYQFACYNSRTRPETFGDFHLKFGQPGVRRRNRMREKPGFPAHSRVSWGAWSNAAMAGWRRRDRTHAFLIEPASANKNPGMETASCRLSAIDCRLHAAVSFFRLQRLENGCQCG